MADAVADPPETQTSPNLAQDSNLTHTSPKKAMSLRAKMDADFAKAGVRTPSTQRPEHSKLPGASGEGDHFPDQDLSTGPKTKAREAAAAAKSNGNTDSVDGGGETGGSEGGSTGNAPATTNRRSGGVGGFTEGKPPGLQSPPDADQAPEVVTPETVTSTATTAPSDDIEQIELGTTNPSEETKKGWKALKGVARDYKSKYEQALAQNKLLEQAAKDGKTLTPELQAQLERSDLVLRTIDLKSHPKFYTDFIQPIDEGLKNVFGVLDEQWAPEAEQWYNKWKEDVRKVGVDNLDKDWWQQNVLSKITDPDLRDEARQQIRQIYRLKAIKDKQLGEVSSDKQKYDTWIAENHKQNVLGYLHRLQKVADDMTNDMKSKGEDWVVPIPIDDKMDVATRQRAEEHNKKHVTYVNFFKEALELINGRQENKEQGIKELIAGPETHAQVAKGYLLGMKLQEDIKEVREENKTLKARMEQLKKENDSYKKVRSAPGKPAATQSAPPRRGETPKLGTGAKGVRSALDAMAEEFLHGN